MTPLLDLATGTLVDPSVLGTGVGPVGFLIALTGLISLGFGLSNGLRGGAEMIAFGVTSIVLGCLVTWFGVLHGQTIVLAALSPLGLSAAMAISAGALAHRSFEADLIPPRVAPVRRAQRPLRDAA